MPDGSVCALAAPDVSLVYVGDQEPGVTRRRSGRGFAYRDASGAKVTAAGALERIRKLAIPPAWTDVWISPDPRGHIQAVGRDAKGRKQYVYHPLWSAERSAGKYARVADFGRALPRIREHVDADLNRRGLSREKVLATVLRLLELTFIRVGNKEYARRNRSYGLTTLTKRHLELEGSALTLHFKGKSGVEHRVGLRDRRLARLLRSLQELPGQHLFKYRDPDGELRPVESADVNRYLREAAGADVSAKDYRTWAGTISAARALRMEPAPETKAEARRTLSRCCRAVSGLLGNTATVCRASYIHPAVLESFAAGHLPHLLPEADHPAFEEALIAFLEDYDLAIEAGASARPSRQALQA